MPPKTSLVASLRAPDTVIAGQAVSFDATGSKGAIRSWTLWFDDGQHLSGRTPPITFRIPHVYATAGTYLAKLQLTDNKGITREATWRLKATLPQPAPEPTPAPLPPPPPAPVPPPAPPPAPQPPPPTPPPGLLTGRLLQRRDLTYVRSFGVPSGVFGVSQWDGMGTSGYGLAYNPVRNSLFVGGRQHGAGNIQAAVAEVAIPPAGAAVATVLQNFAEPSEGKLDAANGTGLCNGPTGRYYLGGMVVGPDGKLYLTAYVYYDGGANQRRGLFRRPLDLSDRGHVEGPWPADGYQAGPLNAIPAGWQARLGNKSLMTALMGVPVTSRTGQGPGAFGFTPADLSLLRYRLYPFNDAGNPANFTYLTSPSPEPWRGTEVFSNGSVRNFGRVFPEGFDTVIDFCRVGAGTFAYGFGVTTNPPNPPVKENPAGLNGLNASTSADGRRVTVPNLNLGLTPGDRVPTDRGRQLWLKAQTAPVLQPGSSNAQQVGCAAIIGKGNSGTAAAYVDVAAPFAPNLAGQAFVIGEACCFDPTSVTGGNTFSDQSTHAHPYRHAAYLSDAHDFAAVVAGTKTYNATKPYAFIDLTGLIPTDLGQFWGHIIGAAYHPAGKRIYVLVSDYGGNGRPLIHELRHP